MSFLNKPHPLNFIFILVAFISLSSCGQNNSTKKNTLPEFTDFTGEKAPSFSALDTHGNTHTLNQYKGKIVVLNFWFIECKPCLQELPELNALVEHFKNKDVVFLAPAANKKKQLERFLNKTPFSYTVLPKAQKHFAAYGTVYFPTHIIIDRNQNVVYHTKGYDETTVRKLKQKIADLVK